MDENGRNGQHPAAAVSTDSLLRRRRVGMDGGGKAAGCGGGVASGVARAGDPGGSFQPENRANSKKNRANQINTYMHYRTAKHSIMELE